MGQKKNNKTTTSKKAIRKYEGSKDENATGKENGRKRENK